MGLVSAPQARDPGAMAWTEHLEQRHAFRGAPELIDGHSRVGEAMGGLADDEYAPPHPDAITAFAADLEDHNRVHEAMSGMCQADEL